MKHTISLLTLLFLLLNNTPSVSQTEKGTGFNFNPEAYKNVPYKVKLTAASYRGMPASASVEKYAPTPGDQGNYGTCVAFAVAYHARTIMTAKLKNLTNTYDINKLIHSPTWVYENIKNKTDLQCQEGTDPTLAFELMQVKGCATIAALPYACGSSITTKSKESALDYMIEDFQTIIPFDETDLDTKIEATKKALAEGHPVVIGFIVLESFYRAKALWEPLASDGGATGKHGRHAMCVVGYDDYKHGGAFRVLNSWGTKWADGGFVWIKYKDYATYLMAAWQGIPAPLYEPEPVEPTKPVVVKPEPKPAPVVVKPEPKPTPVVVKPEPKPQPKPDVKPTPVVVKPEPKPTPVVIKPEPKPIQKVKLEGSVEFKTNTGDAMIANKILTRNLIVEDDKPSNTYKEDLVAYRMGKSYTSGTKFRFFLNSNTESYIYAFATDLSGKVNKILPFADNMSSHIGSNSQIAFPSETKVIKMDENKGTDYLLILFSAEKLDANVMLEKMNAVKGGLSSKIAAALGDKLILPSNVKYKLNEVGFNVDGTVKGKVVPLMVEISHE
jgi:Papain family cysteine protease/Domain of unknown function (DUF4384)